MEKMGKVVLSMPSKTDYIGVFDSGVGGISVLKELVRLMPEENYLYFGDSANAPYGNRTTAQIRQLTLEKAEYLYSRGMKALVVACNTATSAAIDALREKYPELIVVGIEPALKVAADRYPGGHIGVMATPVTLNEEKFNGQLERFPQVRVEKLPIAGLVEQIEAGIVDTEETERLLSAQLAPFANCLDAVVLGCTHYPFVKKTISKILGKNTQLLDGGAGTASQTRRRLAQADLLNTGPGSVQIENSLGTQEILQLSMQLLEMGDI